VHHVFGFGCIIIDYELIGYVVQGLSYYSRTKLCNHANKPNMQTLFNNHDSNYNQFINNHLSEFEPLDRYEEYAIFGTLTYALSPPTEKTQLSDFLEFIKNIGNLNHSHSDLLHYFVRVEYSDSDRRHMHFLLGHHRITNGHHTQLTVEQACAFLERQWTHGNCQVVPYDACQDAVEYVTKINSALHGSCLFSPSFKRCLSRLPNSNKREMQFLRSRYRLQSPINT